MYQAKTISISLLLYFVLQPMSCFSLWSLKKATPVKVSLLQTAGKWAARHPLVATVGAATTLGAGYYCQQNYPRLAKVGTYFSVGVLSVVAYKDGLFNKAFSWAKNHKVLTALGIGSLFTLNRIHSIRARSSKSAVKPVRTIIETAETQKLREYLYGLITETVANNGTLSYIEQHYPQQKLVAAIEDFRKAFALWYAYKHTFAISARITGYQLVDQEIKTAGAFTRKILRIPDESQLKAKAEQIIYYVSKISNFTMPLLPIQPQSSGHQAAASSSLLTDLQEYKKEYTRLVSGQNPISEELEQLHKKYSAKVGIDLRDRIAHEEPEVLAAQLVDPE